MNKPNTFVKKLTEILVLFSIVMIFFPANAYAYVDPGSGGVIVTTVLGFIASIAYTFRKYFYKLRRALFGGKKEEKNRSLDD